MTNLLIAVLAFWIMGLGFYCWSSVHKDWGDIITSKVLGFISLFFGLFGNFLLGLDLAYQLGWI